MTKLLKSLLIGLCILGLAAGPAAARNVQSGIPVYTSRADGSAAQNGDILSWSAANGWWYATAGGFAPTTAKYWTSEASGDLSAEVNLGALTTGLLKHTVAAGVSTPATATPDTDYTTPTGLETRLGGASAPDATEISYVNGVTSAIQTQLNTYGSQVTTGVNPGHQHAVKAIATGTDTLTATFTPSLPLEPLDATKAKDGTMAVLVAAGANTGAVTFAPDSITVKAVKKTTGLALAAGDIPAAGYQCYLVYDLAADVWFLINPGGVNNYVATAGGTVNAITATFVPPLPLKPGDATKVKEGTRVTVFASGASTTAVTFAPDGLAAKDVVKNASAALQAYAIPGAGFPIQLVWNETADKWQMTNTDTSNWYGTSVQASGEIQTYGTAGKILANILTTTTTSIDGFVASAYTAASGSATVRISPRVRLNAKAWNGSVSKEHNWWTEVLPVTGATTSSTFELWNSVEGAAAVKRLHIEQSGKLAGITEANGPVGSLTLTASGTTSTISNTCVATNSRIFLQATNATAAALVGDAAGVYVSARSAATSFTITHPTAAGNETFDYWIVN